VAVGVSRRRDGNVALKSQGNSEKTPSTEENEADNGGFLHTLFIPLENKFRVSRARPRS
jgi:hypothetical protein